MRRKRQQGAKSLDEEYEEIDGLSMLRPPNVGSEKVKMFGVWLDGDVAGRKAGQPQQPQRGGEGEGKGGELTDQEKADIFFGDAVGYFNRGEYAAAVALLERAIELSEGPQRRGAQSRRGGEFRLWQAQALHAQGDATGDAALRGDARAMLKELKDHSDRAVRVVAAEILYIFEAPQLELGADMKVSIPDLSSLKMDAYGTRKSRKAKGNQREYAVLEPGPEKYSIEWVKEQRLEGPAPLDPTLPLVAAALSAASLAFFAL